MHHAAFLGVLTEDRQPLVDERDQILAGRTHPLPVLAGAGIVAHALGPIAGPPVLFARIAQRPSRLFEQAPPPLDIGRFHHQACGTLAFGQCQQRHQREAAAPGIQQDLRQQGQLRGIRFPENSRRQQIELPVQIAIPFLRYQQALEGRLALCFGIAVEKVVTHQLLGEEKLAQAFQGIELTLAGAHPQCAASRVP